MRVNTLVSCVVLAASVSLASACGDGTGPRQKTLNVNALLQETSLGEVGSSAATLAGAFTVPISLPAAANCTINSTDRSYTCHPASASGMTFTLQFTFLDAAGKPQVEPDAAIVDAIHTVIDMSGSFAFSATQGSESITMQRHDDKMLTGLLANHHVVNGTATSKTSFDMGSGSFSMSTSEKTTNVELGPVGRYTSAPIGGTMDMDLTMGSANSASDLSHVTMSFAPSGVVTMVMSSGAYSQTCQWNLTNLTAGFGSNCH